MRQNQGNIARQFQKCRVPRLGGPDGGYQEESDPAKPEKAGYHGERGKGITPPGRPRLGESNRSQGPWVWEPTEVTRKLRVPSGGKEVQRKRASVVKEVEEDGRVQMPDAGIPPVPGEPIYSGVLQPRNVFRLQGDVAIPAEGEKIVSEIGETF